MLPPCGRRVGAGRHAGSQEDAGVLRETHAPGFLLITALLVITGLTTLVAVGLSRAMTEQLVARQFVASQQALALAEAGVDRTTHWLRVQPVPPPGDSEDLVWPFGRDAQAGPLPQRLDPDDLEAFYTAQVTPWDANPTSASDVYTITAEGTVRGTTRTVTSVVQTETFARYVLFEGARSRGGMMLFQDGDEYAGRVHTNARLIVRGEPIFQGPVSSTQPALRCLLGGCHPNEPEFNADEHPGISWSGSDPDFRDGLTMGVDLVPMPDPDIWFGSAEQPGILEEAARLHNSWYVGQVHLELVGDQVHLWGNVDNDRTGVPHPINEWFAVADTPLVYVDGSVRLEGGELDGQFTVVARHILVVDDLTLRCDPVNREEDDDCLNGLGEVVHDDDVLGLVARRSLRIEPGDPAAQHQEDQVRIVQAAMLSWGGTWAYAFSPVPEGLDGNRRIPLRPTGPLHIFGALLTRIGNLHRAQGQTETGPRSLTFDSRYLDNILPPFFPRVTGPVPYKTLVWQEGHGGPMLARASGRGAPPQSRTPHPRQAGVQVVSTQPPSHPVLVADTIEPDSGVEPEAVEELMAALGTPHGSHAFVAGGIVVRDTSDEPGLELAHGGIKVVTQ